MNDRTSSATADGLTLVYLAPRPQGLGQQEFLTRWHEHATLTVRLPGFARLHRHELHAALTPADDPGLPPAMFVPGAISSDYGGVGVARFDGDLAGLADQRGGADAQAVRADERDTFGSELGANAHLTRDEVVFDHGGTTLNIFSFLHRQKALTLQEFSEQWRGFADAFLAHPELTRHCSSYIQAHRVADAGDARFDGIAVMGFRDLSGVFALMSEPTLVGELFKEEEPFLDRTDGVVVLTRPGGTAARAPSR